MGYEGHLTANLNTFTFSWWCPIISPNTRDYRTTDDFKVVPATLSIVFHTSALTAIRATSMWKCVTREGEMQTLSFALVTLRYNDSKDLFSAIILVNPSKTFISVILRRYQHQVCVVSDNNMMNERGAHGRMITGRRKPACVTLSSTNPTRFDLVSNPGCRCEKQATKRLSLLHSLHHIILNAYLWRYILFLMKYYNWVSLCGKSRYIQVYKYYS